MKRLNLGLFVSLLLLALIANFVDLAPKAVSVPDASDAYKGRYAIFGKNRISLQVEDSTRSVAMVIVDAWGVPLDTNILAEDFGIFNAVPHQFAIHNRLRNTTSHAEGAEIKEDFLKVPFEQMDSLLADSICKHLAATIHPSTEGNRENLHLSLKQIKKLAEKYPETIFIVQGAHRPILGTPETRKKYYLRWVPAVLLNIPPEGL